MKQDCAKIVAAAPVPERGPLTLQTTKAVLWSFLGICKRADLRADFERLPVLPVAVGGILAAAIFVLTVLIAVRLAVTHAV